MQGDGAAGLRQKLLRCLKVAVNREDLGCHIPDIVLTLADVLRDPNYNSPLMDAWCDYFLKKNEPRNTGSEAADA